MEIYNVTVQIKYVPKSGIIYGKWRLAEFRAFTHITYINEIKTLICFVVWLYINNMFPSWCS